VLMTMLLTRAAAWNPDTPRPGGIMPVGRLTS
jgi:hypothetical protein